MAKKRQPSRHYRKMTRIENQLYRKLNNSSLLVFLKKSISEGIDKVMLDLNIESPRELIENYDMVVDSSKEDLIKITFTKRN